MSSSPPKVLPHIDAMQGYVPGEQPRDDGEVIKLNTNENPYPPSSTVLQRLREACDEGLRLYPDPDASGVKHRLSRLFDLPVERILVGNGSDELLNLAVRCFVAVGQNVVVPHPTYPYYEKLVQLQGGALVKRDFEEDFSLPANFADADAPLTILANPNSPSGTSVSSEAIAAVASNLGGVLVVDEAYVDFTDGGCIHLLERFSNLIVMRTMSKSFSLAAMRIGYCFADPELITGLGKAKEHYNISHLAQVAAEAALDDVQSMKANAERVRLSRQSLTAELRRLGFDVWDSESNFVLARIADPPAETVYEELKLRRVLVRYFQEPRLRDCIRISVGTDDEIETLVRHLGQIIDG